MSTYGSHSPRADVVCRATSRFRCLLPDNSNGLLRLLTNARVMGRAPRTIRQARETFEQLRADRRLVFATEPDLVESTWRQFMTQPGIGPSSWTDAYLAAFAEAHSYSLVTFDTGFERWPALKLKLLSSTQDLPADDATAKPSSQ